MELPANINPDGNAYSYCGGEILPKSFIPFGGLKGVINNNLEKLGIKPRKNSVVALEYVVSASREYFANCEDPAAFLKDAARFVVQKHGKSNVISINFHFDEGNPHAHIIVLPITSKRVKWKNKHGEGERLEQRLCARDFTGGKELLRKLQQEYYEFCTKYNTDKVTFYRGTKAEEQLKNYTKRTNHLLNTIRNVIENVRDIAELKAIALATKQELKANLTQQNELARRIDIRKQRNKGDGWKKGRDFDIGF